MNSPVECDKSFVLSTLLQLATWAWSMVNCAYFSNNIQAYYMSSIDKSFNIASINDLCKGNTTYTIYGCSLPGCYESLNNTLDEFDHNAKIMVEYSSSYATAFRITLTGCSLLIYSCFIASRYFTKELGEPVYHRTGFSVMVTNVLSFLFSSTLLLSVDICLLAKKIPYTLFNHSIKNISKYQLAQHIPFPHANRHSVLNTIIGDNSFDYLQFFSALLFIMAAFRNTPSSFGSGLCREGHQDGFDRLKLIKEMDYYSLVRKAREALRQEVSSRNAMLRLQESGERKPNQHQSRTVAVSLRRDQKLSLRVVGCSRGRYHQQVPEESEVKSGSESGSEDERLII